MNRSCCGSSVRKTDDGTDYAGKVPNKPALAFFASLRAVGMCVAFDPPLAATGTVLAYNKLTCAFRNIRWNEDTDPRPQPVPRRMKFRTRLGQWMASPKLTVVNVLLCAAALLANHYFQIFCRPVLWAWIALTLCFVPVIFFPLFKEQAKPFRIPLFFLFGCAACICLYCILFLGRVNWVIPLAVVLNPVAILGYLPIFLLIQIIYHARHTPGSFRPLLSGVLLCIGFAIGMATWFNQSFGVVHDALYDPAKASLVPPNYMTELMLGMHIKYHISFCAYDGWRPPLHDPSIVVAAWLNIPFLPDPPRQKNSGGFECPAPLFFGGDRIAVYKSVFPNKAIRPDCKCGVSQKVFWPW